MLDLPADLWQNRLTALLAAETEQEVLDAVVAIIADLFGVTTAGVMHSRPRMLHAIASRVTGIDTTALQNAAHDAAWQHRASSIPPLSGASLKITTITLADGEYLLGALALASGRLAMSPTEEAQVEVVRLACVRSIQRIRRQAETRLLYKISVRLGNKLDTLQLVREVLDLVTSTFAARTSRVFLLDRRSGDLAMMLYPDMPPLLASEAGERTTTDVSQLMNDDQDLVLMLSAESSSHIAPEHPAIETLHLPLRGTIAGQVVLSGEGFVQNTVGDQESADLQRETGIAEAKIVCVPLKHHDRPFGALMLANEPDEPDFLPEDFQLLMTISSIIGVMLSNARLYQRAVRDALTGAYNRGAFDTRLADHWDLWQAKGIGFALLILDLDNFKQINDRFGHTTGDAVLRAVTRLLWETLREDDTIFRYGGEEFCIVLAGIVDTDLAQRIAERLRASLDRNLTISSLVTVSITASIGVALHPIHGATSQRGLIELADDAAYQAKRTGKNRVVMAG
ncbi:MAG TPA: sensor domain-containing diguanylate cyclase [Roseiflexaceae bacterium]|nr:sensor domain-containing diguanylate cyclase [Roseiflexaceae bacterium]HMP41703.1 sensor domain-containing diguanylate cyclase [Roseiflexaceae bacterium]